MSDSAIEYIAALIFIILNFAEPILGIPTFLSYLNYFSYTPTANVTQATAQLTSTVTGLVITLPSVIINEIIDSLLSGLIGTILAMLLSLSGGGGGGGSKITSFVTRSGERVTFRHK